MVRLPANIEERSRLAALLRRKGWTKVAEQAHGAANPVSSGYERYGKRAADIAVASLALVITMPINCILAVGTYIDVGRPIIFKQARAGRNGKPFVLYKFRNMTNDTDERGNLLPPEERVTKWGRFVRSTSLDELLNFWSILKGDMSIIGPRPLLPEYTERYCSYHRARLSVRPGLECPPQPRSEDAGTWEGQFNDDVWYAEHVSFATDLRKVVRLVEAVFNRKSAAVRGGAARSYFVGYGSDGKALGLTEVSEETLEELWDGFDEED